MLPLKVRTKTSQQRLAGGGEGGSVREHLDSSATRPSATTRKL